MPPVEIPHPTEQAAAPAHPPQLAQAPVEHDGPTWDKHYSELEAAHREAHDQAEEARRWSFSCGLRAGLTVALVLIAAAGVLVGELRRH